ncbi:protein-L-isoaspartate O-methyltransferase [mine drainage metagenome]|jgi:protein-L-isoaspartate(D-aspartate) O-methyltransferase|uniref:Protein-L-isoaspartate O-methyltransferase n=1 Tax=mine drainage metagenome TaxID=410659 RepID=A0A1J5RPU7_9ZZZZ
MDFEQARFNMIEQQVRPWDVLAADVLDLLGAVKREDFVPAAYRNLAFTDMEIPLPCGESMLAPRVEARLLQELALRKHETVLEIGTGSGFVAALLGHSAAQVTTVEIHPELADAAQARLRHAGVLNATVRCLDASRELPPGEFDAILLSGSVAQIPDALVARLKVGGRLCAIVGDAPMMRAQRLTRLGASDSKVVDLFDTVAPRLHGFAETPRFRF